MPRRYQHFAEFELITVVYLLRVKPVFGASFPAGVNLRRIESGAQLSRTTYQISVNVRFKDVGDGHSGFARGVDVNVAVCTRIKYRRDAFVIIADQIRKFSNPFCLNCLKNE
jgi:hypothetical protein